MQSKEWGRMLISDHLHRIQVTLSQVCFQAYPELCGRLPAVNALREPEEFHGSGRKEKCKCARSQWSTKGWCLQSKNTLCLCSCLMQSTESPGTWHINQGSCLWDMCSHHQIQWCPWLSPEKSTEWTEYVFSFLLWFQSSWSLSPM